MEWVDLPATSRELGRSVKARFDGKVLQIQEREADGRVPMAAMWLSIGEEDADLLKRIIIQGQRRS